MYFIHKRGEDDEVMNIGHDTRTNRQLFPFSCKSQLVKYHVSGMMCRKQTKGRLSGRWARVTCDSSRRIGLGSCGSGIAFVRLLFLGSEITFSLVAETDEAACGGGRIFSGASGSAVSIGGPATGRCLRNTHV